MQWINTKNVKVNKIIKLINTIFQKLFLKFLKFIIVIKLRTDEIIKYIYYNNSLHMGLNYVNQYFVFRCDLINITENRKIDSFTGFKVIKNNLH